MNDPNTLRIENLPAPIADKLSVASQRIRRIIFLRGLFTVLSIAFVTLLAVMVIDAATLLFSSGIRWLLSLSALTVICSAGYWHMFRPLRRKLSLSEIARIIETRSENLKDERISSTVEILSRQYNKGEEFSPVLLNQLVMDAEKDADVILPHQLFTMQSAKRVMISLGVIAFVYLLLFVIWPSGSARLLVRAVAPFADVGGALADRLHVRPGDVRLASGDPLTIEVGLKKPAGHKVELRTRWEGNPELIEHMQSSGPEGERTEFSTVFPRVNENFEYRIRAGHALTRFHRVQVFPRPEISNVHLKISPPGYTGLTPYTEVLSPGRIQVLAGSQVQLSIETTAPLEKAELILDANSLGEGESVKQDGGSLMQWQFQPALPARSFDWQVKMKSRDGFENKPVHNHLFTVTGDEIPLVTLVQPDSRELKLSPRGFLTLQYRVEDDFGISSVNLKVTTDSGKEIILPQTPGAKADGGWPVTIPFYLQSLPMEDARSLTVQLEVADNLPESMGGPNTAVSESIRILLEQGQENFVRQQVKKQHEQAGLSLENAVRDLEKLSRDADEMNQKLDADQTTEAMEKAGEIRSGLQKTALNLSGLVSDLENGVFDAVAKGVEKVVDEEMKRASGLGEKLPLTDDPLAQKEIGADLKLTIEAALQKLRDLQALNDAMAEDAFRMAELEELNLQQEALAEQATEDDWEENREEWQANQQALADELAALTEQERQRQEMAEHTQNAAATMQQAAEEGENAAEWAEQVVLPPWMVAQDQALQAQRMALAAQERVLTAQNLAGNKNLSDMAVHQQRAEKHQSEADIAQLEAERAQKEALSLLKAGGTPEAVSAQEQANRLQADAKRIQLEADTKQQDAGKARDAESKVETPEVSKVKAVQTDSEKIQQRAYAAQQKAIREQTLAVETSAPELDQALSEAVAQQQAAEAAQQAAMEAQQLAEQAMASDASPEEIAKAQEAAAQAQQEAREAQQAAVEAQQAAQDAAETPEQAAAQSEAQQAQQEAQSAQQTANEAQEAAQTAAQQAQESGLPADQEAAETAQQEASAAQEQAAAAQQAASAAQPQSAATRSQTAAQQSAQAAEAAAGEAAQAAEAAAEAGMTDAAGQLEQLASDAQAAAQAMSDAAGQPGLPSSHQAMRESAAQMSQIAQAMQGLTPPSSEAATSAMAQAASQAAQAAQSAAQSEPSQSQAAAQAAAAAQSLQQAGQSLAQQMGMESPPSASSASSESQQGGKDNNAPNSETLPKWVSDIGMSNADWVRMRSLSDPDGASLDESGIPREYRQLVRDYFIELNREQQNIR